MTNSVAESNLRNAAFPLDFVQALEARSGSGQGARRIWEKWLVDRELLGRSHVEPLRVIDLFAGCGGLSLGFASAGFEVVHGFDSWSAAVDTYNANFDHPSECLDLSNSDLTVDRLSHFQKGTSFPAIIGGPPCQDFSAAGKRQEKDNADLTRLFAEYVGYFRPPLFVMENVPNAKHFRVYESALDFMRRNGYHVNTRVFDASLIGAPQRRKRLFAIGTLDQSFSQRIQQELFDAETALGDVFRFSPMTVERWFGEGVVPEFYYRHPWSYDRRGVFRSAEPSPTIRGVNRPKPPKYVWHEKDLQLEGFEKVLENPSLVRALNVEERKQLQTFPEEFKLLGSRTAQEQMVGNAVPVMLAHYVADKIARAMNPAEAGRL